MSDKNTKTVTKFWFAWNAEEVEKWLENMASEGWLLDSVSFKMKKFHFKKGSPCKISFCLDFKTRPDSEYFSIAEDDNWNLKGTILGWHLWSKEQHSEYKPEFFSDVTSLIKRFRTIMIFLSIIAVYEYIILYGSVTRLFTAESIYIKAVCLLQIGVTLLLTVAILKLNNKIRSIKNRNRY